MYVPILCRSREEWTAARSVGIGASDAAALLGLSRFKNPFELWHEKKGLIPPPKGQEFARRIGLRLEDPITEMYREETKRPAVRPEPGTFIVHRHHERPYLLATLDGQTLRDSLPNWDVATFANGQRGVLEIKTAAFMKRDEWETEPPLEYIVQVQHQMMVTGAQWASIAALVGGIYFVWADIPRDESFINDLIRIEEEFYQRLQSDSPPEPDGSGITKDVIKRLLPAETTAEPATLPPEAVDWDAQRVEAKAQIAEWTTKQQEAEAKIKLAIGEHAGSGLLPNGVRYTFKTITKKPYSVTPKPYRELRRFAPKSLKERALKPGEAPELEIEGF